MSSSSHPERKLEHLQICLREEVQFKGISSGFERYRFLHNALPDLDLRDVDTSGQLLGHAIACPLLISPMTGGAQLGGQVNRHLAVAAQRLGLPMGVGSQRTGLIDPEMLSTYQVRDVAPDILLFANLGAVQFNYGFGLDEARRAVESIGADVLMLHLNPLHEALQPHGDTNFAGLLPKIGEICAKLSVPVVVKEVGYGLSEDVIRRLKSVGVAGVDVAGAGGTSWGAVEKHRMNASEQRVAAAFADWGIPTVEALMMARAVDAEWPVIASGGVRTGVDIAKSLSLGATAAGLALPLLKAAMVDAEGVIEYLEGIIKELRLTMFAVGAKNLEELRQVRLLRL